VHAEKARGLATTAIRVILQRWTYGSENSVKKEIRMRQVGAQD
jgi:hypothetical protein